MKTIYNSEMGTSGKYKYSDLGMILMKELIERVTGTKFEEYRKLKHDEDVNDPYKLVMTLDAYASDKNYFDKVKSIIKMLREDYTLK